MDWQAARTAFSAGEVIAYPTEAVFGLGCDPAQPAAVEKLFQIKQRDPGKGLILLAANYSQVLPYVEDKAIPQDKRFSVLSHWPGPVTLLLPASSSCPAYLRGDHDTIAVRVTAFEPARQLCLELNSAIISTSANRSGAAALTDAAAVQAEFGDELGWVMQAPTGGATAPSRILNPLTGQVVRTA